MLLKGKFLKPLAEDLHSIPQNMRPYLGYPLVLIEAPAGYLLTQELVAVLEHETRPIIWLRLGTEDRDPAACFYSLVSAFREIEPHLGEATCQKIQQIPGPQQDWYTIYTTLANELADRIQSSSTLVIEHLHLLPATTQTLTLLVNYFIPTLPEHLQIILTSKDSLDWISSSRSTAHLEKEDLKLVPAAADKLYKALNFRLSQKGRRKADALIDGRSVALVSLARASQRIGLSWIERSLENSRSITDLFLGIVQVFLNTLTEGELASLNILAYFGCNHPDFSSVVTGQIGLFEAPWSQPLTCGWVRSYQLWIEPLKKALDSSKAFRYKTLIDAADFLSQNNSSLAGIELILDMGSIDHAVRLINKHISPLLASGHRQTITRWLGMLPDSQVLQEPWLLHARAELKSSLGEIEPAMQMFQQAGTFFLAKNDFVGACASLLAVSTISAWLNDFGKAWACADEVLTIAREANLVYQQGWAEFTLACLSLREGKNFAAVEHFDSAAHLASQIEDPDLLTCVHNLVALISAQEQQKKQTALYQHMVQKSLAAETSLDENLQYALQIPPGRAQVYAGTLDWLAVPFIFKFTVPVTSVQSDKQPDGGFKKLISWLFWPGSRPKTSSPLPLPIQPGDMVISQLPPVKLPEQLPVDFPKSSVPGFLPGLPGKAKSFSNPPITRELDIPVVRSARQPAITVAPSDSPVVDSKNESKCQFTAYMLGRFRLDLNGTPLKKIPGGRSGMLLKYLIYHHKKNIPREQLMELLWPDADPETARNRLNVALNSLRRSLRTGSSTDVIVYEDGKYYLDSSWQVWLDVDEFENHHTKEQRLEGQKNPHQTTRFLQVAANLYQGDFLEEDLYEEWTIPIRERLRLAYLDALYKLCQHYFQLEQFAACASLCQTILQWDSCREDVHCLLMRCYTAQNQLPLALRQYQLCMEALSEELGVQPSASTTSLYKQLSRNN